MPFCGAYAAMEEHHLSAHTVQSLSLFCCLVLAQCVNVLGPRNVVRSRCTHSPQPDQAQMPHPEGIDASLATCMYRLHCHIWACSADPLADMAWYHVHVDWPAVSSMKLSGLVDLAESTLQLMCKNPHVVVVHITLASLTVHTYLYMSKSSYSDVGVINI